MAEDEARNSSEDGVESMKVCKTNMKVAVVGSDAILRHKITEVLKEYEIVEYIIEDMRVSLNDNPEILNGIPGQDWRGKGKRKMRKPK